MREYSVDELRKSLAEAINRVAFGAERVVIVRHGKAVGAIVSIDDLEKIEGGKVAVQHRGVTAKPKRQKVA